MRSARQFGDTQRAFDVAAEIDHRAGGIDRGDTAPDDAFSPFGLSVATVRERILQAA